MLIDCSTWVDVLYGSQPPQAERFEVLDRVFELGCRLWDTAGKHPLTFLCQLASSGILLEIKTDRWLYLY